MRITSPLSGAAAAALALVAITGCDSEAAPSATPDPSRSPAVLSSEPVEPHPPEITEADLAVVYRTVVPRFLTNPADLGWADWYPQPTVSWDRLVVKPVLSANDPPLPGFGAYGTADVDLPPIVRTELAAALSPIAPTTFGTDLGVPGNDPENCTDECGFVTISNVAFEGETARVLVRVDNKLSTNATEYTLQRDGAEWRITDVGEAFRDG